MNNSLSAGVSLNINKILAAGALLCSLLTALMASRDIDGAYIAIFLACVTAGFVIEVRGYAAPPRTVVNICSVALVAAILSRINLAFVVEPLMETLLVVTAVKMLERKRARDYMQLLLLNLSMLICYAMVSMEMSFILYCFGEGLVWSFIMTLCSWQKKDYHAAAPLRVLAQLFSRLMMMFLLMLPFCLLMFMMAPRFRSPFFTVQGGVPQVGFTEQVRLGETSEIQRNNQLAFRAETPRRPGSPYWRGIALDLFDGARWRSSERRRRGPQRFRSVLPSWGGTAEAVRQEMYLEPGRRRYLFALDVPVSVSDVPYQITNSAVILYQGPNDGRRLQYTAYSVPSDVIPMSGPDFDRELYLALPNNFIPALRDEVQRITAGLDDAGKISAILEYLSPPRFQYTITDMPESFNALEDFLFESRRGSCEFFASAMGVMLRMAGIPSRLVGGYRGGVYNDTGGYYAVFEASAHVWVELWDDDLSSWARYDPTPPSADGAESDYEGWESYMDLLDYQWTRFVLNYNLEMQGEFLGSVGNIISNPRSSDFAPILDAMPAAAGAAAALFTLLYIMRRIAGIKRSEALPRKFLAIMRKKGFTKHKSEGLREFACTLPESERLRAMPFIEGFEKYYYKDKSFDPETLNFLTSVLQSLQGTGRGAPPPQPPR